MSKAEQFIKDYTNHCSNEMVFEDGSGSHLYEPWLTPEQALRVVEIEREELIDKAWDWVEDNLLSSNQQDKSRLYFEQFKNFIKGE